jgi:hypothetical protein
MPAKLPFVCLSVLPYRVSWKKMVDTNNVLIGETTARKLIIFLLLAGVPVKLSFCSYWVPTVGTGALFPGLKRLGYEADHSPPTSGEVKNLWIYTSTLPNAFMA